MCGIAGICAYRKGAPPVVESELLRMRDAMHARGPDEAGHWVADDRAVALGHRRLSIIDLSNAAHQPMSVEGGRFRIVFNGEIYNYKLLREHLEQRGRRFCSESDTEVLLHMYAEYGPEMVRRLRGMFAFAIWDETRRGLFLARDPFGIKPLYFHDDGETLRFASQVKALLAGGGIDAQIEPAGHVGFFLWGSVPEPFTLYRGLRALPAGHTLWVGANGAGRMSRYFDIMEELRKATAEADGRLEGEPREILADALRDTVRHHLVADVPVGVFLSAGIDSGAMTALASEEVDDLRAVTLGFREYQGTEQDEVPLARKVASTYGCRHHVVCIECRDFVDELPRILAAMDQPSTDGVNTYFVARVAREAGLKVALSGLGGDEFLGGYPSFRQIPRLVALSRFPAEIPGLGRMFRIISAPLLRRMTSPKYAGLLEYGGTYGGAYLLRRGLFMPWELPELLDPDLVREGWGELQPLLQMEHLIEKVPTAHARISVLEMTQYMRNTLLRDADWAGMAHSLEIRVPLVDVELFRAMAPHLVKGSGIPSKVDLAHAPQTPLPSEVTERRKTGFSVPVREWLFTSSGNGGAASRGLRGWARFVYERAVATLAS